MQEQRSPDWYRARLGRFTASEIHNIMGVKGIKTDTAQSYIKAKVAEVITGLSHDAYSPSLQWGEEHEYEAKEFFVNKTGFTVSESQFVTYGEHAGGSSDGCIITEGAIIEIKCPFNSVNHVKHLEVTDNKTLKSLSPNYYWQMQANMLFTEMDKGYFISYDPRAITDNGDFRIHYAVIEANKEEQELIIDRISQAVGEKMALLEHLFKLNRQVA